MADMEVYCVCRRFLSRGYIRMHRVPLEGLCRHTSGSFKGVT